MPLHKPLYDIGDRVSFMMILDEDEGAVPLEGNIQVVDAHGTYETNYQEASYDVAVDDLGWFKHIGESYLTKI